jgi:hypothetical protein
MVYQNAHRAPFRRVVIRKQFSDCFPLREFNTYGAFMSIGGECLKSEPRTKVMLFERERQGTQLAERFIIKHYYYPVLPRTRTWYRHSKGEHEFRNLLRVSELGIHSAEPVAFGVRRTITGCVFSCFIVTRYVENTVTLEGWAEQLAKLGPAQAESGWPVCQSLGQTFRILHLAGFFLFTAKPGNILIRRTEDSFETILIDLPYALRIKPKLLRRYAQAFDLAVFLGNAARLLPPQHVNTFYKGYFPDPLENNPGDLVCRLAGAIRWRRNETPVSRSVHKLRRSMKEFARKLAAKNRGGESGVFEA